MIIFVEVSMTKIKKYVTYYQNASVKILLERTLPSNKILEWSKFESTIADNKMKVTENLKLVLGREENIVGKGENAG